MLFVQCNSVCIVRMVVLIGCVPYRVLSAFSCYNYNDPPNPAHLVCSDPHLLVPALHVYSPAVLRVFVAPCVIIRSNSLSLRSFQALCVCVSSLACHNSIACSNEL